MTNGNTDDCGSPEGTFEAMGCNWTLVGALAFCYMSPETWFIHFSGCHSLGQAVVHLWTVSYVPYC